MRSERQERDAHEAQDGETHGVLPGGTALLYGERFLESIIDTSQSILKALYGRAAAPSNAENYWSLTREAMPLEAARAVSNSTEDSLPRSSSMVHRLVGPEIFTAATGRPSSPRMAAPMVKSPR